MEMKAVKKYQEQLKELERVYKKYKEINK